MSPCDCEFDDPDYEDESWHYKRIWERCGKVLLMARVPVSVLLFR